MLDDVMSELDMSRRDYLLNHLDGRQVFITCCDPETVRLMETGRGFYVEKGTVQQDTDEKAGESALGKRNADLLKASKPVV